MTLLYHEQQEGKLCGVHTLNTLLQAPIFTEVDLAQIASDLDAMEKRFMAEGGLDSNDYMKFVAEESGNAALDGNFSIQVLTKALEVWGLTVTNLQNPTVAAEAQSPHLQLAFICNLQEHWFTLRKVDGGWWNFNSIYPAPQPLGTFYLDAFLGTLRSQGYTIFIVKGIVPDRPVGLESSTGRWFTPEQAKEANDRAADIQAQSKIGADGDNDIAAAMAASLSAAFMGSIGGGGQQQQQQWGEQPGGSSALSGSTEDDDLARAIAASLSAGKAPVMAESPSAALPPFVPRPLPDEPADGAGVLLLGMRLPDGSRLTRRFSSTEPVQDVIDFLHNHGLEMSKHELATAYPRRVLADTSLTLAEVKLSNKETLCVELKRRS
mmetsp:Transcript_8297/g.14968  ORF Transcript_8297/g.14968 Transcript_8297/m.14968 type:complete len:379 (-) Transcript_8297:121-1257(-)